MTRAQAAWTSRRPGLSPAGSIVGPLLMVLTCATVGALAGRSPGLVVAGTLGIVAFVAMVGVPRIWLGFCLVTLATAPELIPLTAGTDLGHVEVYKGLLLLGILPMMVLRGVDRRLLLPLAAYAIATSLSLLAGTPPEDLGTFQTLSSLLTLTVGWFYVVVAWDWERDQIYLKILAALPVLSVVFAIVLTPLGDVNLFQDASPPRLQGAVIAAMLGGLGAIAASASVLLWRRSQWPPAIPLGLAAGVCTFASLGRGAILALLIATTPALYRFFHGKFGRGDGFSYLKLLLACVCVAIAVFGLAVPALQERSENTYTFNRATQKVELSKTSGRSAAWKEFYAEAEVNLTFGRGMGSGPVITIAEEGFEAQHNEYLRLLLELGYVGGLLVLAAVVLTVVRLIGRAPAVVRPDMIALALAFAFYSAVDNTVTDRHLGIPILATLAIGSAVSSRGHHKDSPKT